MKKTLLALALLICPHLAIAQTFSVSTTTLAIGAGTPSRAITIQVAGTTGSTTSFALTDGGLGGVFFPASPVTIAAGTNGSTQFVYTAPSGTATSTPVTLTATATGGISATHALSTSIGTTTAFAQDNYSGTASTAVLGRSAATGGVWQRAFLSTFIDSVQTQDGLGNVYISSAPGGTSSGSYYGLPATSSSAHDQDVTEVAKVFDNTHNYAGLFADWNGNSSNQSGYYLLYDVTASAWKVFWQTNNSTSGQLGSNQASPSPPSGGSTITLQISTRTINGSLYIFPYAGGTLISGFPIADSHIASAGFPGILTGHGANGSTTTGWLANTFKASNAAWNAPPITGTYYISATGSDANNGTSTGTPWQTLGRAALAPYGAGSNILLHCGDSFAGTLAVTMTGTAASPDSIGTYGTCPAATAKIAGVPVGAGSNAPVISAGSGVVDGIDLGVGSEYIAISGLAITGAGWTGTQPSITVLNGGYGIKAVATQTSSPGLRNVSVLSNTISGFQQAIFFDATSSTSVTGWQNLVIASNDVSNNLTGGILTEGANYPTGPMTQFLNEFVGFNKGVNIPGDPNSGTGGVHGSVKTEAWLVNLTASTGASVLSNYSSGVGGWGGFSSGLTFGGSASIQVAQSTNFKILGNEVTLQGESTSSAEDGAAIDTDTKTSNYEVAYNLSYSNVGPGVQWGSSSGSFLNTGGWIHHNISYLDNQSESGMNQGSLRSWGNSNTITVDHNTVILPCTATSGTRSVVDIEIGTTATANFIDNIFESCSTVPFFHGTNSGQMASNTAYGNDYFIPSGTLKISDIAGSSTGLNIATLASWQSNGYETLYSNLYGITSNPGLVGGTFTAPTGGFLANSGFGGLTFFNLSAGAAAIGAGVDTNLVSQPMSFNDFHHAPSRYAVTVDQGAVAGQQPASGTGPSSIVVQ